jgi:hypothetical protein
MLTLSKSLQELDISGNFTKGLHALQNEHSLDALGAQHDMSDMSDEQRRAIECFNHQVDALKTRTIFFQELAVSLKNNQTLSRLIFGGDRCELLMV